MAIITKVKRRLLGTWSEHE